MNDDGGRTERIGWLRCGHVMASITSLKLDDRKLQVYAEVKGPVRPNKGVMTLLDRHGGVVASGGHATWPSVHDGDTLALMLELTLLSEEGQREYGPILGPGEK